MFRYIPLVKQILEERKKNARLEEKNQKNVADIEYIAMMSDIELEIEEAESEVTSDE